MRLVARIAGGPAGVIGWVHLGKLAWLGDVGCVATDAKHRRIQLLRLDRRGIVGVFCLRSMARLAGNSLVHALALHVQDFSMATLAHLVSGIGDGQGRDLGDRVSPVVPVAAETAGNEDAAQHYKRHEADQKDGRQPEEVTCIFEGFHSCVRKIVLEPAFWRCWLFPLRPWELTRFCDLLAEI